ncbi:MAG: 50S ribosomal protein L18 [Candidatus Omnitrophota bacterium]
MRAKSRIRSNRIVRHLRIRKKVSGDNERPRLCVYRSVKHFEAQVINDFEQRTLVGHSTKSKEFLKANGLTQGGSVEAAVKFGKYFAEQAKAKGIKKVVFDRGGCLYHGRIKAFADAAREAGLEF